MSMPKYKSNDYEYAEDCELPLKFRESKSHMLRLVRAARIYKYGIFGNSRGFREKLKEPYDPTNLQEDYYFATPRAKRDIHYDAY